jgi:hypothetical protein
VVLGLPGHTAERLKKAVWRRDRDIPQVVHNQLNYKEYQPARRVALVKTLVILPSLGRSLRCFDSRL